MLYYEYTSKGEIFMKKYVCILPCLALLLTGCSNSNTQEPNDPMLKLDWYSSIDTAKQTMSAYHLDAQSEEVSNGQLQTLLDYDDVQLYGQSCDVTLCFTSLGLIGINYHADEDHYEAWTRRLTEQFGTPSSENENTTIWENPPLEGTLSAYVFRWEDDVQISFFADDTGSETVPSATEAPTEASTQAMQDVQRSEIPAVNGFTFYADMERAKVVMGDAVPEETEYDSISGYHQTLIDYDDVQLYGRNCDLSLCFTSLGLVGINYQDVDGSVEEWTRILAADYGEPTESSDMQTLWDNAPLGEGTSIYILKMEDDVQISFFADDTGSE